MSLFNYLAKSLSSFLSFFFSLSLFSFFLLFLSFLSFYFTYTPSFILLFSANITMFSFTYNPVININFTGQENRRKKKLRVHAPSSGSPDTIEVPVYAGHESVSGTVEIAMASHKKIDHQGIRIELVGQTGKNYGLIISTLPPSIDVLSSMFFVPSILPPSFTYILSFS